MADASAPGTRDSTPPRTDGLRRMSLAAAVLVVIQVAIGMVVNLYVTVPAHHPGAQPANYFSGSARSVAWAIGSGPVSLAVHGALGLAVIVVALAVAGTALRRRAGWAAASLVLAALLAIGAGFNGASFLDFGGRDVSSLLMALLALGAVCCYLLALYLLPGRPGNGRNGRRDQGLATGSR